MQISRYLLRNNQEMDADSDQTDERYLHRYAWTFRLVNICLHSISTQLFAYILINHLSMDIKHGFLASIHFAIHPIHTEAVSSIVGRSDLLAAIFMMLTFIIYKRMLKPFKSDRMIDGIAFTFTSILSLLSKETGIAILPICIGHFIYKFYLTRRTLSSNGSNGSLTFKRTYQSTKKSALSIFLRKHFNIIDRSYPLILSSALLVILVSFRIWMLNGQLPIFTSQDNPAAFANNTLTKFLTFSYLASFNLYMLFNPSKLSYDWQMNSIPLVERLTDLRNLSTLTMFVGLLYLIWISIRERNKNLRSVYYFGIAFLVLPYMPASNLFAYVGFVVAERTLYVPSIGFSTLFILAYIQLKGYLNYEDGHKRKKCKKYLKSAIYFLFAMFLFKTLARNQDWLTRESLFKSGLRDLPHNAKIQYNYANLQKDLGRVEIAIHHYQLALRYWPNHESAHNNLAVLLDDPNEAEKHLLKTIDLNPFHSKAYFNLANIYSKREDHQHAITLLKKSIEINPDLAEAYSKLGSEYVNVKEFKIAMQFHQHALRLQPQNADFLNNYGVYLYQIGLLDDSIRMYRKALEFNFNHKKARENLSQLINKDST